jgi:hypothetical protein
VDDVGNPLGADLNKGEPELWEDVRDTLKDKGVKGPNDGKFEF